MCFASVFLNFIDRCLVMQSLVLWRVTVFFTVVPSRVLGVIFSSAVIDICYAHATLSTAHIISMSSTKRLLIDWIMI